MSTQLDKQVTALHKQNTEIKDLTAQIKDLCEAHGMLEDRVISAEHHASQAEDKVDQLEETINTLKVDNSRLTCQLLTSENYSKKCNLKFFNISESPRETQAMLIHKLSEVLDIMNINLSRILISNIHRLPSSLPGPRPIVIKFCSYLDRDHVWGQRHLLREKNVKVYVSQHFNTIVEANIKKLNPIRKAALKAGMKAKLVADKLTINSQLYTVDSLHLLPKPLQPANLAVRHMDNHIFFFHEASPFSNFHPSPFTSERVQYSCAEQYIQHKKAILFADSNTATQVMETSNPYIMKSLGNKVTNFNSKRWLEHIPPIATTALHAKFIQNPSLKSVLLESENKVIVEASPKDKIWGIGCYLHDPEILQKKKDWGSNLLGKALMEVRENLRS
jgi:ribA/ribD-fused uncharacterized protein